MKIVPRAVQPAAKVRNYEILPQAGQPAARFQPIGAFLF